MKHKLKLGVNIDHVATLRQARRGEGYPDIIEAAKLAIAGGADSIVAHLREDRRHINDADINAIRKLKTHFDMEMAATDEMLKIALRVKPDMATIVPEKRQELTTEGGLDVKGNLERLTEYVGKLEKAGIKVSLFVDPEEDQIKASSRTGASFIEIHTGAYSRSLSKKDLNDVVRSVVLAKSLGLRVNAGHGLNYDNAKPIAKLDGIEEFNIGFSVIARSVFVGLKQATAEMKKLILLFIVLVSLCSFARSATKESAAVPTIAKPATAETVAAPDTQEPVPDWLKDLGVTANDLYPTAETVSTAETAKPSTAETSVMPSSPEVVPDWLKEMGVTFKASTNESVEPPVKEKTVFNDVPPEHWAASSVNSLVRMGITQGYPDGTFRGGNYISRYETAIFLSKLAHAGQERAAANEKLIEELRAEIYKIKYSLDLYKKPPEKARPVSVDFDVRTIVGNLVGANAASPAINAPLGPVFDYRLRASYKQELNEDTFVRIGMDTMDSARSGGRDLVREMLEGEAQAMTKWGLGVDVTSGPGLVIHKEGPNNIFPSEDNTAYLRPYNGIKVFYNNGDLDTGLGYKATAIASDGAAAVNDAYTYISYTFKNTFMGKLVLKYSADLFNTDLRATYSTAESTINMYEMDIIPSKQVELGVKFGAASSQQTSHNVFAGISVITKDLIRGGSEIKLFADKIGSDFFGYPVDPAITGVNLFNKLYQASTYDIGMEMSQAVTKALSIKMIGDVVTGPTGLYGEDEPDSNSTFELDTDYSLFEGAVLNFGYRTYQKPSALTNATSDMLMLGFRYNYY
jgi:pyridoxine 5-phosphate synthase